jgi:hypothetical protein
MQSERAAAANALSIEFLRGLSQARVEPMCFSTEGSPTMRSIFVGIILLSASMTAVGAAQAQGHHQRLPGYGSRQALISHRQPTADDLQPAEDNLEKIVTDSQQLAPLTSRDGTVGAGQVHSDEDALTKRIEEDNARLDHERGICPSCGRQPFPSRCGRPGSSSGCSIPIRERSA